MSRKQGDDFRHTIEKLKPTSRQRVSSPRRLPTFAANGVQEGHGRADRDQARHGGRTTWSARISKRKRHTQKEEELINRTVAEAANKKTEKQDI